MIWWLLSIMMQIFRLMCLLFYNIWISSKSKSLVWPSGVFRNIGTTRSWIISLNPFVNGKIPSSLVGWVPKPCTFMLLDNQTLRVSCNGKNQVPWGINLMLMLPFIMRWIKLELTCVFGMKGVVLYWEKHI